MPNFFAITVETLPIAAHGGSNPADRDVPLVVYAPGVPRHEVLRNPPARRVDGYDVWAGVISPFS
jgi:hypothetical protein